MARARHRRMRQRRPLAPLEATPVDTSSRYWPPPEARRSSALLPLVVIPTYDEVDNIEAVLDRVRNALPEATVLVVDDNSPDGTAAVVERLAAERSGVRLLRRPGKDGLGNAYRAGFAYGIEAGHRVIIEMDADLSHDPADLPRLVGAVAAGADLAIGSRYVWGGATPSWSWHRRLLSTWGNRYAGWALGLGVRDATSGFRAYRSEVLQAIDVGRTSADGYGFQVEMADEVRRAGGTIVEVPISFAPRTKGSSKMSSTIVAEAMWMVTRRGLAERLRRLGRSPLRPAPAS